jgi:hypothetical protein
LEFQISFQAREFRRKAQANAAADARTLFKREAEWYATVVPPDLLIMSSDKYIYIYIL